MVFNANYISYIILDSEDRRDHAHKSLLQYKGGTMTSIVNLVSKSLSYYGLLWGCMHASGKSPYYPVACRISDINVISSVNSEHIPQYDVQCQYEP